MPLTDDEGHRVALPGRADAVPGRPAAALLAVTGLSKWWPGRATPTLDGLDLEMRPGDVLSITGRNGAGKTTLLRILGGLVAPDSGDVRLGEMALGRRRGAYQRQIGLLTPGDRGLYARVTVQGIWICGRAWPCWTRPSGRQRSPTPRVGLRWPSSTTPG